MNEYTPSTDEVRINYIGTTPEFAAEKPWQEHRPAEFDRWLDAHDAHIRATAINEVEEHLVRRDCFTERTFRMIDELRGTR